MGVDALRLSASLSALAEQTWTDMLESLLGAKLDSCVFAMQPRPLHDCSLQWKS